MTGVKMGTVELLQLAQYAACHLITPQTYPHLTYDSWMPPIENLDVFGVFSSVLFHILHHNSDNNECLQVDWDKNFSE